MKSIPAALAAATAVLLHATAWAHGDVTPHAVDTKALPALGAD